MQKPITRYMHGAADYSYAAVVSAAPELVGFTEERTAATLCRVLGSGALLYSLLTRYEWGLYRVIPFKAHLVADVSANVLALGAPWLFRFARNRRARNTFLAAGLIGMTVVLLTQNKEMP
jgi:hypothetical protein